MMMNPQAMVINMLRQQAGNNPVLNNALHMAEQGNMKGIENLCRNICNERGIDPNNIMEQAMNQLGNMRY